MNNALSMRQPVSREQNFSFSTASNSASAGTLTYLLNNTRPLDFHEQILKAVRSPMAFPQDIDNLLHALEKVGIIIGAAQDAAKDARVRHCVRCHKTYLERNNGFQACQVAHDKPRLIKTGIQSDANTGLCGFKNYYPCCDQMVGTDAGAPSHYHFVGRHTTVETNVRYNPTNVLTCVMRKCAGQGAARDVTIGQVPPMQSAAPLPSRPASRMEVSGIYSRLIQTA